MSKFILGQAIVHDHYGEGKINEVAELFYKIDFGKKGIIDISKRSEDMMKESKKMEPNEVENELTDFENAVARVLEHYDLLPKSIALGDKWHGGIMTLQPGSKNIKPKEIPIETFFHKIVMVRDRLRVMEQQINTNPKLDDEDKINLQQYITKIYGSLTTFNILFKNDNDHFVGDKKE